MDFTYKITGIDEAAKAFTVEFEDGTWANVSFTSPFPKSEAELDDLVKQFTASEAQVLEARADSDAVKLVQRFIGVERLTSRLARKGNDPVVPPPAPQLTLERRRDMRWDEVKAERERRISGTGAAGVLVDGIWFHADAAFRNVITQSLRLFELDALPDTDSRKKLVATQLADLRQVRWKTMSNDFVVPDLNLATKIDVAHALLSKACYERAEQLKYELYLSENPEMYPISTGWPARYIAPTLE